MTRHLDTFGCPQPFQACELCCSPILGQATQVGGEGSACSAPSLANATLGTV